MPMYLLRVENLLTTDNVNKGKKNMTGSSGQANGENFKGFYRLGFQNMAVGRVNGVAV